MGVRILSNGGRLGSVRDRVIKLNPIINTSKLMNAFLNNYDLHVHSDLVHESLGILDHKTESIHGSKL